MTEWSNDRDRIQARVIEDSVSQANIRLTTLEVTMHRFVLAEFNTHRTFSRNSESSRAVPFRKRVEKVLRHPAIPVSFPAEQRGMSGGAEVENSDEARRIWVKASQDTVARAQEMADEGVHKSIVNRMLEPYLWHTVVVTATEWDGFFHQRLHEAAQPEIRLAAEAMHKALESSVPNFIDYGEWHLPFITKQDWEEASELAQGMDGNDDPTSMLKRVSTARCARTSYVTHDGVRSLDKDLGLYKRLAIRAADDNDPHHWSPLEHVATPSLDYKGGVPGNFRGWFQHRHELDVSPYV